MDGLDFHGAATLLLTISALFLFTRERLPLEYSCAAVLLTLVLGFELFPYDHAGARLGAADFLAGLGNEALITILLLLIIAKGMEVSGALRPLARLLAGIWLRSKSLALLATLAAAATLSAFMNNTPIVVMLVPLLVGVAHRIGASPSGMLLPVGFATIVGGMSTTIGTSSNLLIVSVSADLGLPRLEMFDFVLPGAIAASVAVLYLWAIAPRLLPQRKPPLTQLTPRLFESIIDVTDYSPLVGETLASARRLIPQDIRILHVRRKGLELVRLPSLILSAGDQLHTRGTAEAIQKMQNLFGDGFESSDLLRSPDEVLVEIVVMRKSPLFGKKLSAAHRLVLGSLIPVGIARPGAKTTKTLTESADPTLASGDIILMQGKREEVNRLRDEGRLLILARSVEVPRSAKAPLALAIMAGVVLTAALGWMPIIASALCGAVLMLFGRCLALDEAWTALDVKLILVILTSLALGTALTHTGAAEFVALQIVALVRDLPPPMVLSAILLCTALLTEIVTNNAVAVISTPIAMVIARELGMPELALVLAVLFGANMSYLTPIGYQTNLLIFSAGGYRFSDFFRVGLPLQLIIWITLSITLPILYL